MEECLITSWNAINHYVGTDSMVFSATEVPHDIELYFRKYRHYVRSGGEYVILYRAREEGVEIANQRLFDELSARWHNEVLSFKERFYTARQYLRANNLMQWIALHKVFDEIIEILRMMNERRSLYIVTMKDKESVLLILQRHGININEGNIFDVNEISDKLDCLSTIARNAQTDLSQLVFIDDNITHLIKPKQAGVNCYMAGWGYSTEEQVGVAIENFIPVISLSEAKSKLVN